MDCSFYRKAEFDRVRADVGTTSEALPLLAEMCRLNTITSIKLAGSGHMGTSLSSMDILTYLYFQRLNVVEVGWESEDRDVFFSSKGHDVPALYAVLHAVGILDETSFLNLRRAAGGCGHPAVGIPGIEANSGSLGMGIAKAKGVALAKRKRGLAGDVFVLTGDGELQEGSNYESLQHAVNRGIGDYTVIVDHNKVQSDRPVERISSLGDLEAKFRAFGWQVRRVDGHDFAQLADALEAPQPFTVVIADTLKGKGVSFMEHPRALEADRGLYRWHAGAPDDDAYGRAIAELKERVDRLARGLGLASPETVPAERKLDPAPQGERIAEGYGSALLELIPTHPELLVLDADLAADCCVREVEERHPRQFLEHGIAEQDMVSTAGGLARHGYLPVLNSFASFLSARANEQIYNNACEGSRIVYACHYAGLLPAAPGESHQSVRDISLFRATPDFTILHPSTTRECYDATRWAVEQAETNVMLRLLIGRPPQRLELPEHYRFHPGRGCILRDGQELAIVAYGPVMLPEALRAAELLERRGVSVRVVQMSWMNRWDPEWWTTTALGGVRAVCVVEDHASRGGLGEYLLAGLAERDALDGRAFRIYGVDGIPRWGTPQEALEAHGLDGASLARRIRDELVPASAASREDES
jgi:transketolase